uniref:Uncharacterized protein n=1 Tax=Chelonoidis abingdonii TaxID=106734 RepID=A0A8C0G1G0_CHEAB
MLCAGSPLPKPSWEREEGAACLRVPTHAQACPARLRLLPSSPGATSGFKSSWKLSVFLWRPAWVSKPGPSFGQHGGGASGPELGQARGHPGARMSLGGGGQDSQGPCSLCGHPWGSCSLGGHLWGPCSPCGHPWGSCSLGGHLWGPCSPCGHPWGSCSLGGHLWGPCSPCGHPWGSCSLGGHLWGPCSPCGHPWGSCSFARGTPRGSRPESSGSWAVPPLGLGLSGWRMQPVTKGNGE